jgi:hypothetical protein
MRRSGGTLPLLCVDSVWTEGAPCPSGECVPAGGPPCNSGPNEDADGDGFTPSEGDCNDCTAAMNPGAVESAATVFDDDCNGTFDNAPQPCDANLALDDLDPKTGARAIDLCRFVAAGQPGWGVIDAKYTRADGTPRGPTYSIGLVTQFGTDPTNLPHKGARMLGLSSGAARNPSDPGYNSVGGFEKSDACSSFQPEGLPPNYQNVPEPAQCAGTSGNEAYDSVGLRLKVKTPTNAKSFSFSLPFYTYEFPHYHCSSFNDLYATLLSPKLSNLPDANISFDSMGGVISVNAAGFLAACDPQTTSSGTYFPCPLGYGPLLGTGFDEQTTGVDPGSRGSASRGWLQMSTPIENPGSEIELFFVTWDAGDCVLDSTTVIDDFQWSTNSTSVATQPIAML